MCLDNNIVIDEEETYNISILSVGAYKDKF